MQRLDVVMVTRLTSAPMPVPPITAKAPFSCDVTDVDSTGTATIRYRLGPLAYSGGGPLGAALASRGGQVVTGTGRIGPDGRVLEHSRQASGGDGEADETLPSLAESLEPFPTAMVGVGARWQVTSFRQEDGGRIQQTSDYHLVAFEGDDAFRTDVERRVVPVDERGQPKPGAQPTTSSGQLRFTVGRLHPTGRLEQRGEVDTAGMQIGYTADVRFEPR